MLLAIAVTIRFRDPGPILFRQVRVGKLGREFTIYKFRTMIVDAEAVSAQLSTPGCFSRYGPIRASPRSAGTYVAIALMNFRSYLTSSPATCPSWDRVRHVPTK